MLLYVRERPFARYALLALEALAVAAIVTLVVHACTSDITLLSVCFAVSAVMSGTLCYAIALEYSIETAAAWAIFAFCLLVSVLVPVANAVVRYRDITTAHIDTAATHLCATHGWKYASNEAAPDAPDSVLRVWCTASDGSAHAILMSVPTQ